MAVVVEPIVTIEKLRELLAEGHEQEAVDYKEMLDLSHPPHLIEFVKDVAAMQAENAGGYIVIGCDDHGKVVPGMTSQHAKLFDESRVRSKIKKYVAEPFEVRIGQHEIDGHTVMLVYIAPAPNGWSIFTTIGEYQDPAGKQVIKFRVGDVFVRRGTSSDRWQDTDRIRLVQQLIARKKDAWRAEFRTELEAMNIGLSAQSLGQMPSSALTWKLDAEGFDELVTELVRREDDVPLTRFLLRCQSDADRLLTTDFGELTTLLDRLTSAAALALTFEREHYFLRALETIARIYEIGVDERGYRRSGVDTSRLWLLIAARITALGGLTVRLARWSAARQLANRKPRGRDIERYANWLRHAQVMASQARILDANSGLIAHAHNAVRSIEALHPDMPAERAQVLNSLCQFDALAGLVVIGELGRVDDGAFYPNFARYYGWRTEPVFALLVRDQGVRRELFEADDTLLAAAIQHMSQMARQEGSRYDGWEGLEDKMVRAFVQEHAPSDETRPY